MPVLIWLRRLFWRWCPHRCRYRGTMRAVAKGMSGKEPLSCRVQYGTECYRCGTAVWFHVRG